MKIIKDFDLLSPKWLDIIFENKNKQYGAYELRNDSSNRHLKALVIVFAICLLSVFLPRIVATIEWRDKQDVTQDGGIIVTEFNEKENENEAEEQMQQEYVEPPPILQQTIQVTQWEIAEESNTENMMTTAEIDQTDVIIASTQVDGEKEGEHIDNIREIVNVQPEPEVIYDIVEIKAQFPGGERELTRWLNENIKYPLVAQENGIQGKVFVSFVVRTDGRIDDVKVVRGVHPSLDNEAIRLVRAMPRWRPGKRQGTEVSSRFNLPVTFVLR